MQLERIWTESMCSFTSKTLRMRTNTQTNFGKIDNTDSFVGTFLHTDTASNTEFLRDETNLGSRLHLHTKLSLLHERTISFAFEITTTGFALQVSLHTQ